MRSVDRVECGLDPVALLCCSIAEDDDSSGRAWDTRLKGWWKSGCGRRGKRRDACCRWVSCEGYHRGGLSCARR